MCRNLRIRSQGLFTSVGLMVVFISTMSAQLSNTPPTFQNLDKYFSSYQISELRSGNEKNDNADERNIKLTLDGSEEVTLILSPIMLLSDDHVITYSNSGLVTSPYQTTATTYRGYIKGKHGSEVRLTIDNDFMYGYIQYNKKKYFIEPLDKYQKSSGRDQIIIYTEEQVKKIDGQICGATLSRQRQNQLKSQLKMSGSCQVVELAIAVDYNYRQLHGGTTGAINQTIAVMNMVDGVYEGAFSDDIRFEIVEHYISNCSGCNPWTSSTNANTLLSDFSSWAPSGFNNTHDLGQLWTARDICGDNGNCSVAGLAWINAVCGSFRYHILEDFTTSAWQLRVLVSHEMGHNFGALHDGSGSPHIMAPSISTNTTTWSSGSVNSINSALLGFSCFEDCVIGSCTEIVSINTNNCTTGNPSTYNLNLEIRHGGGGSAANFDVIVNGQHYTQTWASSPQIVTISGLTADGSTYNTIQLAASDGSDTGCAGSGTFESPSPDCQLTAIEDFNDCTIPDGWSSTTTNNVIFNGGDPLVQYKWKFDDATRWFANYDDFNNASSLKTIDGSCMALMDDDIFNHSLYTGDVVLYSPTYDMTGYDTVQLVFDYNFHPFEDGGKGSNNSYFNVAVFDGVNWITIAHDVDSTCPWYDVWPNNCTTTLDLDLSSYKNSEFGVRFTYSDGNNSQWTGMVALDNVQILGKFQQNSPTCSDGIQNGSETGIDCGGSCEPCPPDCEPIVIITPGEQGVYSYEARDLIITSGSVIISQSTTFAADAHNINADFEVSNGVQFNISGEGCED